MPRGGPLYTAEDLLVMVRRFLAEPGPSRFSNETLYGFLALAAHEVSKDLGSVRRDFQVSWPANTPTQELQAEIFDVISFLPAHWLPTGGTMPLRLRWVPNEDMQGRSADITGVPEIWTLEESAVVDAGDDVNLRKVIRLWPTPSEAGTAIFDYVALSPTPTATRRSLDPYPIRRAWRDLMIHKCLEYCYENLGRTDLAERKRAVYKDLLGEATLRNLDQTTGIWTEYFDGHRLPYV